MQRYTGRDFTITVGGIEIKINEASLEPNIGTGVTKKSGKPSGWGRGEGEATGMLKMDGEEYRKLNTLAGEAGSWEMLEPVDIVFFADTGVTGESIKIEAADCKLKPGGISISTSEAEGVEREVAFDVTGEDFVKEDGVPLMAPR